MTSDSTVENLRASSAQPTTTQIYVLYINANALTVWQAITQPEQVGRFFHGMQLEASYEVGGHLRSWAPDRSVQWGDNTVLEWDPPRRMVYSWRSLYDPALAAEAESRVTWEVEPAAGDSTKLTLIHDRLEHSPKTAASVQGWSWILSNLKTVIETGQALPPIN